MAVTAFWYGLTLKDQWGATATDQGDYANDDYRTSLHTVTYTPNVDTDDYWNDATNEISGTGYTTQGHDHASLALTYDTGTDETRFAAEDAQWTTASFTVRHAVHYNWETTVTTTAHLHSFVNMGADQVVSSGTFTVEWTGGFVSKIDST